MDWEGKISTPQLTCSVANRPLAPGEIFFSALVVQEREFKRLDFCADAWAELDHNHFISWWRQRAPQPGNERKPFKLNAATLAQIFTNLKNARTRSQQCLAYVVALALVRARKLHFLEVTNVGEEQFLLVQNKAEGVIHRIRDPQLGSDEEAHVLHNLLELTTDGDTVSDE